MNFPETLGHEPVKQKLISTFEKNRIPSAYLFLGENGIGKSLLLREFAQMINCETHSTCHTCPNCRLFDSGNHPDFIVIKPDGKFIKIGQIQELLSQLNLKPAYASKRVVMVREAQRMNQESANSFLKMLEEPPLDTLIVLMTTDENLLLETIISRCQKISFSGLEQNFLREVLEKSFELNSDQLEFVLNYSSGRIRKDLISNVSALYPMRHQILAMLLNLEADKMIGHFDLIDQFVKKDLHEFFIEFCANWLRDFLMIKSGSDHHPINKDILGEIDFDDIPFTQEQLQWAFDLAIETELAVKSNAAKILAFESLLIQLKQLKAGAIAI